MGSSQFDFPERVQEPLVDAARVRGSIARFGRVEDVADAGPTQRGSEFGPRLSSSIARLGPLLADGKERPH